VADSLTDAARKSLINAVLSSGKVVADDLSSELWEEIKNFGSTRTGKNIMARDRHYYMQGKRMKRRDEYCIFV
jgi:hypothetical protein